MKPGQMCPGFCFGNWNCGLENWNCGLELELGLETGIALWKLELQIENWNCALESEIAVLKLEVRLGNWKKSLIFSSSPN